jgi:chaperonin GroEL
VAVINVGAATESEMKEKKARVEDALHATRAAVEEGIVPGGGVALIRAQAALKGIKLDHDEQIGVDIIRRDRGADPHDRPERRRRRVDRRREGPRVEGQELRLQRLLRHLRGPRPRGVIDPTKVTRTALQNAASIASLLLTTECLIVEKKEKESAAPAAPGGGMGGMY